LLDFRLAHARARDAVHAPFDAVALADQIRGLGTEVLCLESAAKTQADFLRRPDMGRRLAESSRAQLVDKISSTYDLAIIVSDGLSSLATTEHALPLLAVLLSLVRQSNWTLASIIVITHGRVAVQDEIGELLRTRLTLMLLGERPGLGAADSLGAYFTYAPHLGLRDASRNCVSNIRAEGLSPADAARKLFYLLTRSLQRGLSGVELKDDSPSLATNPTPGLEK
jgi:ethanolamine ammonia-lyase small subunit